MEETKAIFWDRDGVITPLIDRGERGLTPPWSETEFKILPGVSKAMFQTKKWGYLNFVISNQPDVRSGELDFDTLENYNSLMMTQLPIVEIVNCFDRGSWNYKPNPGMILELQKKYNINLKKSWMIGDTWKDAVAANLAKVEYIHLGKEDPIAPVMYTAPDLPTAIDMMEFHDNTWRKFDDSE